MFGSTPVALLLGFQPSVREGSKPPRTVHDIKYYNIYVICMKLAINKGIYPYILMLDCQNNKSFDRGNVRNV